MATIYSILYVTFNATLNEKVGIGLFMTNGIENIFKYSPKKLSALKGLLSPARHSFVKQYFESLYKELKEIPLIQHKDLSYLSNYSNNIIRFSEPKKIEIPFGDESFDKLFEKYIFKDLKEKIEIVNIKNVVKESLFPKIKDKVNLQKRITSTEISNVFSPIIVDFIGENGVVTTGKTIDFTKAITSVESDIAKFISLSKALELEGKYNGKYFILGREPQKNLERNHQLWQHINDSNLLEFVDIQEMELVKEYIFTNDVKPYFPFEQSFQP